jgi:hypothetical protein
VIVTNTLSYYDTELTKLVKRFTAQAMKEMNDKKLSLKTIFSILLVDIFAFSCSFLRFPAMFCIFCVFCIFLCFLRFSAFFAFLHFMVFCVLCFLRFSAFFCVFCVFLRFLHFLRFMVFCVLCFLRFSAFFCIFLHFFCVFLRFFSVFSPFFLPNTIENIFVKLSILGMGRVWKKKCNVR